MSEIISGKQLVAERIVTDVEVEDLALGFMGRKSALGRIAGAPVAAGGAVGPGDSERKGLQRVGTARGRDRDPAGRAVAGKHREGESTSVGGARGSVRLDGEGDLDRISGDGDWRLGW